MLLVAVALVFAQTARFNFVNLDDNQYVCENQHVLAGGTGKAVAWAFTHRISAQWTPLTTLSLIADVQLHKTKEVSRDVARLAGAMHVTNAVLHAVNAVLVFLAMWKLSGRLWPSAWVAAIFAVHPVHVESIAWVTARKDVLSGLFGLLALLAYAWYSWKPGIGRYGIVAAALALGLMAKPILVTWPVIFLLMDYWPLRRPVGWRLFLEKIPLLLLVAGFAAATFVGQWSAGSVVSAEAAPLWARIGRAAVLYVHYLRISVWPSDLAIFPTGPMESPERTLAAAAMLVLLTVGTIWGARRGWRWLAVGWLWFLVTLLPTIGLVQVGFQVAADRFLYLPQVGLSVAVAWSAVQGLAWFKAKAGWGHAVPRAACAMTAAVVVAAFAVCAWRQTTFWRDSESLWIRSLACVGRNFIAHNGYGVALERRGELDAAIDQYRKSLEFQPCFADAHDNLGHALAARGDFDGAIAHHLEAIRYCPDFALAYHNLGLALAKLGHLDDAMAQFQKAIEINPDLAEAHYNLGLAFVGRRQWAAAIARFRQAVDNKPDFAEAELNLAAALASQGDFDGAIASFQKAAAMKPDYALAQLGLGDALAASGRREEAGPHYEQALALASAANELALVKSIRAKLRKASDK